jgi:HK97 gp10 family phage protein
MPANITFIGFKEFRNKLHALPGVVTKEVDAVVQIAGSQWEQLAKSGAPVDQGRLRANITNKKTGEMSNEVSSPVEYSPYVEFGTKTRVQVPADLQTYANQFKGGRGGGNAKEMIYEWMKRVGIPPERQWIVYISIMVKGIRPHPFFFPPAPIVEKQLFSDIKHVLDTEH